MMRRTLKIAVFVAAGLVVLTLTVTLPWRWLSPPTTSFILIKGQANGQHPALERRWVAWEDISAYVPLAIIAAEDQKFATHHGFDVASIRETLEGPSRRGASTISQQLAKNLYLWPGRNWVRKGLEAYLTLSIEILWPKRRILEVYMNVVEFGPGIFGIHAASEAYFGKMPAELTAFQAALLAAVLPNPHRMSPARPSAYVFGRVFWILDQMEQLGGESYLATM